MANVFTAAWDETKPDGDRDIPLGDDDIREFKEQVRERLEIDHHFLQSEGSDENVGFHDKVTFLQRNSDYDAAASTLILYGKKSGSYTELFGRHENAGIVQYTVLGKLNLSAFGIDSEAAGDIIQRGASVWERLAIGSAYARPRVNAAGSALEYASLPNKVLLWFIQSAISTGTRKSARIIVPFAGTIKKWRINAKTPPAGADILVDINKNGATLWGTNQGNRVKCVAAAEDGSGSSFDTTAVAADDFFDIDIDQVGSSTPGSDVTVELEITPQ